MKTTTPKTGTACHCKRGQHRDNCPDCEGTGIKIDFAAIRAAATSAPAPQDLRGSYRTQDGKAQIDYELEHGTNGFKFSAMGDFDRSSGQCIDSIAKAYPDDSMIQRIAKVWGAYHLNDMQAGTPAQMAEVERRRKEAEEYTRKDTEDAKRERYFYDVEMTDANWHSLCRKFGHDSFYSWECAILKEANLYEVPHPDGSMIEASDKDTGKKIMVPRPYKFGTEWLSLPIPPEVIAEIRSWEGAPVVFNSLADHKAAEFLERHGIKLRVVLSDSKPAQWEPSGHHYRVTLSAGCRSIDNPPRRQVFDFWGSRNDADSGKDPSPADVLCCIASDIDAPETFADYCAEFGEEGDSIKAKQTFKRCARHAERLQGFFTKSEQKELQEIK